MANVFDLIDVDTKKGLLKVKQATKVGYIECYPNGCFDGAYPKSKLRRGRVQSGGSIAPTITCCDHLYVFEVEILKKTNQ